MRFGRLIGCSMQRSGPNGLLFSSYCSCQKDHSKPFTNAFCEILGDITSDVDIFRENKRITDYSVSGMTSTLRQDLSDVKHNAKLFSDIISRRFEVEASALTSFGLETVLIWARKLGLDKSRWDCFLCWYEKHSVCANFTEYLTVEIALAAGAHSREAWCTFTAIYEKATGRMPQFDLFILAAMEQSHMLRRARAHFQSLPASALERSSRATELRKKEGEVQSFILLGLDEYSILVSSKSHEHIVDTIMRSSIYFGGFFLAMRYVWQHILENTGSLSEQTYAYLIGTCANRHEEKRIHPETMLNQAKAYWNHYKLQNHKPYSLDVFLSLLTAYCHSGSVDTGEIAASVLSLDISGVGKREIIKCALFAAAKQRDFETFCTLEEYCKANEPILGDMQVLLARRRMHLLTNKPDNEVFQIYEGCLLAYKDKYLTDMAFRWLEQRSDTAGHLLECIQIAEKMCAKLESFATPLSAMQVECLMLLYAKASSIKGITLYQSTKPEVHSQKARIAFNRITYALGLDDLGRKVKNDKISVVYEKISWFRQASFELSKSSLDSRDALRICFNKSSLDLLDYLFNEEMHAQKRHVQNTWDPILPKNEIIHVIECTAIGALLDKSR